MTTLEGNSINKFKAWFRREKKYILVEIPGCQTNPFGQVLKGVRQGTLFDKPSLGNGHFAETKVGRRFGDAELLEGQHDHLVCRRLLVHQEVLEGLI